MTYGFSFASGSARVPSFLSLGSTPRPLLAASIGDSRTAAGNMGNPERTTSNGYQFWAEALSRGRVRFPAAYNFGVAGETSAQILARIQQAIDCPAPIIVVLAGVNDATGEDSAGNVITIVNLLAASGKQVILVPELPRTSGWTNPRIAQHLALRDRLLSLTTRGVAVADPWADMVDPTTQSGGIKAGLYYDLVHPNNTGAHFIGKAIAGVLNRLLPEPLILPATWGTGFDATANPTGCLTPNPMFFGTGGTLNGGATGQAGNSVTVTRTGTDITVACSKVTTGGKEWQQVTVSGTPTTNTQRATISQSITLSNVAAGDVIQAVCEFEVDAGSDEMHGPSLEINPVGGATAQAISNYDTWARGVGYAPNFAHGGVMVTPPLTIQSGLTSLPVQVIARPEQGVASSMTFRVRALGARKVI